jgi:S-formylglutathione hydrolase FrmB
VLTRRILVGAVSAALALGAWIAIRDVRRGYWSTDGATVSHLTLHSRLVHRDLHEIRVVPKRHSNVVLVLLHGRGSKPSSWLDQTFFGALRSLGTRAPVVLLLDGGDHSYWHDRADGRWASMVLQEAIPKRGRVAIGGISMGGYGALLIGARGRFCAVGGHSPALWFHAGDSASGAFDDAADYARNDIVGDPPRYRAPVWIDVGTEDPFHDAAVAYAHEIHAQLHVWPGGHDRAYWSAHMRQYLAFYARACG